jgi:hypothetical protein
MVFLVFAVMSNLGSKNLILLIKFIYCRAQKQRLESIYTCKYRFLTASKHLTVSESIGQAIVSYKQ